MRAARLTSVVAGATWQVEANKRKGQIAVPRISELAF
jgi:hypothetical protein